MGTQRIGIKQVNVKVWSGTVNPNELNDVSAGANSYAVGDMFVNTSNKTLWLCVVNTDGEAIWRAIGSNKQTLFGKVKAEASDPKTVGTHGTGVFIPNNALILDSWYKPGAASLTGEAGSTLALRVGSTTPVAINAAEVLTNYTADTFFEGDAGDGTVSGGAITDSDGELEAVVAVDSWNVGEVVFGVEFLVMDW